MSQHDTIIPNRYAELRSRQGIEIIISYTPEATLKNGEQTYIAPCLHVAVEGFSNSIRAASKVDLVLVNRRLLNGETVGETCHHVALDHTATIDELSGFTAAIMAIIELRHVCSSGDIVSYAPQVAVCVDGVWQIDPLQDDETRYHNFNFCWKPPLVLRENDSFDTLSTLPAW